MGAVLAGLLIAALLALTVYLIGGVRIDLQPVDFELDAVVAAALDLMCVPADDKGLDVICDLSPQIHRALKGDPHRLRQVLINLLGKAVKFTQAGQVCLRVVREPSQTDGFQTLRFSISDTSSGIPLDCGGTGLSLTISCEIVERMGGCLEVTSIPGQGRTFSFAVPFEIAARRPSRPDSSPQSLEVEELAPWYLEERRSDLVALAAAFQSGDYEAVQALGHNLKASGAGYGFDPITKIGASLEAAAKEKSDSLIGTEISALGDYLSRVELVSS
jgi:hypothetical protein